MQRAFVGDLSDEITLREGLEVWAGHWRGSLEDAVIAGTWSPPEEGETLLADDGSRQTWKVLSADEDGWFRHDDLGGGWDEEGRPSAGGYVYLRVDACAPAIVLLHAMGSTVSYVNGEPRVGDHCWSGNADRFGYIRLPIALREGPNHLLFHCQSCELMVKLASAPPHALLEVRDATLPDLIVGEETRTCGAVLVVNPSPEPRRGLTIAATCAGGSPVTTPVPPIPPLGLRKVGFRIEAPPTTVGDAAVQVELRGDRGRVLDSALLQLRVRGANETHQRTFVSRIDGSVQAYGVNPPSSPPQDGSRPALLLTLHGSCFEPIRMAESYASKPWVCIVAPTGRRCYGYDWEDWGALDALEVLEIAQQQFGTDSRRVYLAGHSMGGHGTWHIGQTFPDRFAAIGPGAAWLTRWTYAGNARPEGEGPLAWLLDRSRNGEDTLALAPNLAGLGVYITHGDADDNVPVGQSRMMKERLDGFHRDVVYQEHAEAGHWWTKSAMPIMDAADWPPLFEFLARRQRPARAQVGRVDFITANPGVSAWRHWAGIEAQLHPLAYSTISIDHDPARRRFVGTTDNVARLALDLAHLAPGEPVEVELDGQPLGCIPWPAREPRAWFTCERGKWSQSPKPPPSLKGPRRYGPLKLAFLNRPAFVYGTAGTPEENAWAFGKARYDAEVFWHGGNASVEVLPDIDLDPPADPDRNLILYGHAQSNRAWGSLLADSPVQVAPGLLRIADRELRGDDLACLFLRPRPGSDVALVGVIGGTGVAGMRLTRRRGYLSGGADLCPDWLIIAPEGDRAAGYFGMDWGVESGEFAWPGEIRGR